MARVLAVDPGDKRVGLALSDPTGTIASPLRTLDANPRETLPARLLAVADEMGADTLVVGLPLRLSGGEGPEAKAARALAAELRALTRKQVRLLDERLTSAAAERALLARGEKRAERRRLSDQVAAAILLQTYLETASRGR